MDEAEARLAAMWEPNRRYLRRFLVSLARDLDLADDLLQETYLHALAGLPGYRGGDARAWLAAIAKNAFRAYARRRYVQAEVPLEDVAAKAGDEQPGTDYHLDLLALQQAVSNLPPDLRRALVMRHLAGFSYREIAEQTSCPLGTAKRRAWTAIQRLRAALASTGEETTEMECPQIGGVALLDYVSGRLPEPQAAGAREHLGECPACRRLARELRRALQVLDQCRDALVFYDIHEVCEDGSVTYYGSARFLRMQHMELRSPAGYQVAAFFADGREVPFETIKLPEEDATRWLLRLPESTAPDEHVDLWQVCLRPPGSVHASMQMGPGEWRLVPEQSAGSSEYAVVLLVRLPAGTRSWNATPRPHEIRRGQPPTLVWRHFVRSGETPPEPPVVDYALPCP